MAPLLLILYLCHWFSSVSAGTNCQDLRVQPINQLPRAYLSNLDRRFYKKFVSANGIPVMCSNAVSDYALKECARIIRGVTNNLSPGFLKALTEKKERIALWAKNADACSIPETAKPCDLQTFSGGLAFDNILILQETSFDCDERGNAWIGRVLVHEFSHGVNGVFDKVNRDLQPSLERAYKNAKAKNLWPKDEYGLVNNAEYFALGAQAWFEANEQRTCDIGACNGTQLRTKDRQLYDLVSRVYRQPNWLYKCSEACDGERRGRPAANQCCVTVYEHDQFNGRSKRFCGSVRYVGDDWNDRISSIKIQQGCVAEIYENRDYAGREKILQGDFDSLSGDLGMNDEISSLKVRPA